MNTNRVRISCAALVAAVMGALVVTWTNIGRAERGEGAAPLSDTLESALDVGALRTESRFEPIEAEANDSTEALGCYWTGWSCGETVCAPGTSLGAVDFNISQSEGCWGDGNDYDEPMRRIQCCSTPAVTSSCYWSGWGCGVMTCGGAYYMAGVDFNINRSEGCWGHGNDYDEPMRRVRCCEASASLGACFWSGWGCGEMACPADYAVLAVDFNAQRGEGCWGDGNDYDEPMRRVYCCH